ncbi:MAG: DUF4199 domain-containing protein [Asticcacaulis sp.]
MIRFILVYGVIAGLIVMSNYAVALFGGHNGHSLWAGYTVMLAALSLVFIGIKRYRDTQLGGVIRFTTALGVGFGIAAVASAMYVLGWEVYMWATHYTFFDDYAQSVIAAKRAHGASEADIAKLSAQMAEMGRSYANPLYRMMMTLLEIAPVGVIVTLISAGLLRMRGFLPACGR